MKAWRNWIATDRGPNTSGEPITATTSGHFGFSSDTITTPALQQIQACVPAIVMLRAPLRSPPGLKVTARSRKLLSGLPSRSVPAPTRISPSSRSVT